MEHWTAANLGRLSVWFGGRVGAACATNGNANAAHCAKKKKKKREKQQQKSEAINRAFALR